MPETLDFEELSLDSFKGAVVMSLSGSSGKWLVLFSYPLDFTFVCPTEIRAFSERVADFKKIGCEVVAFSCDSEFSHLAWINQPTKKGGLGPMNIPVLSDRTQKIARDYGCLVEPEGYTTRSLYIIDPEQVLRSVIHNGGSVGRNVDEVLRLVQAYQFSDEYGEVCPAGWTPGQATIKPDPKKSLEYFEKH